MALNIENIIEVKKRILELDDYALSKKNLIVTAAIHAAVAAGAGELRC